MIGELKNDEMLLSDYPLVSKTFNILKKEYPSFLKTRDYIFTNFGEDYFNEFELFLGFYVHEAADGESSENALFRKLKSFIRYSHEFLVLQVKLNRTKEYQYRSFKEVEERVYKNSMMSDYYLDGLALSQYLWPNHYKMNRFLIDGLRQAGAFNRAIDVPCGPGVQSWLIRRHLRINSMSICDLSEYSVRYARKLHQYFGEAGAFDASRRSIEECDSEFELVVNGELLEHVEDPARMLTMLDRLLAKDGIVYLTTAIFAAAIDHIYMFRSVQQVREMLEERFMIVAELALPVSLKQYRQDMYNEPINYACFLRRK